MTLFSIFIRDDGEVLSATTAPHQGDDCDGLVYKATDEKEHDVFLFFIMSWSQGEAVRDAREMFDAAEYVALDPMWQPGSVWPDKADENLEEKAVVQIYSEQMHTGYITTVPTHCRTHPFIDHIGDRIMWAYMRDVTARLVEESQYWQEFAKKNRHESEVPIVREAVAEPIQQAKQLSFDFG